MERLPERDELWMAYLDGELSAAEAAAFAASLSDGERALSESEVRLESALAERLGTGETCPPAVWDGLMAQLEQASRRPWWKRDTPLRVAAVAVLAVGAWAAAIGLNYDKIRPASAMAAAPLLSMDCGDSAALVAQAEVKGGPEAVQAFLDQNKVPVRIQEIRISSDHGPGEGPLHKAHGPRVLGAGIEHYGAVDVPAVYVECCGRPVKVVFVHTCGKGKGRGERRCKDPDVVASERYGSYVAFVVTKHRHGQRVLSLFAPSDEKLAAASVAAAVPAG